MTDLQEYREGLLYVGRGASLVLLLVTWTSPQGHAFDYPGNLGQSVCVLYPSNKIMENDVSIQNT